MSFGEKIKELRTDKKMTLQGLSEKTGLSKGYLSKLENGHRGTPKVENVIKLADGLGESRTRLLIFAGHFGENEAQEYVNKMASMPDILQGITEGTKEVLEIDNLKNVLTQEAALRYDLHPLSHEDRQKIISYIERDLLEDNSKERKKFDFKKDDLTD